MGGNAKVIDRKSGKTIAYAEKIDLHKVNRFFVRKGVLALLEHLNDLYKQTYKEPIWKNFKVVKGGEAFSGSSRHFFNRKIVDSQFVKTKRFLGDIDVMVPEKIKENFERMMKSLERKLRIVVEGDSRIHISYLGQDRTDFGTTFLGVFRVYIPRKGIDFNLQIDFEYVEFLEELPSTWASFSHSSDWGDMLTGMKGVHHKFLLINLVRSISKISGVLVATPSSTPEKIRLVNGKRASQLPRRLAFSVDKGLRVKFREMKDSTGNPVLHEEKRIFQEIRSEDSVYLRDPVEIFEQIFGKKPDDREIKKLGSFWGIIFLLVENVPAEKIEDMFDYLLEENLYGKYAQVIEKNNSQLDMKTKQKMIDALFSVFPYLQKKKDKVEKLKEEYYAMYYNKRYA